MAINKYEDLNDIQLDVLKEVGNIGSGNAATALSAMINRPISIEMPVVRILGIQEAIDDSGGPEKTIVSILVRLKGELEGMILFLLEQKFADVITETFFGKEKADLMNLDEGEISAMSEIGNIMASSYVSAIAQLTGLNIGVQAPSFTVDMLGAVMTVPAIEFENVGDKLMYIDKTMQIGDVSFDSKMMLIPTVSSLSLMLSRLGVEV